MSTFLKWFESHQQSSTMAAVIKPLAMATEWRDQGGFIGRDDNAFYRGVVADIVDDDRQWEQFLLQSTAQGRSHGVVLLAYHKDRFLVQAKAEPGNETPGKLVLTTTVQASYENLRRHEGAIAFSEYSTDPRLILFEVAQDGGMFMHKRNDVGLLVLKSEEVSRPLPESHAWASRQDILALAGCGLVSEFLLQALGIYSLLRMSR